MAAGESADSFDALRHPVRVRIIEACTDFGPLSPKQIVDRGLCADVETVKEKNEHQQLSHIAYHCRRLEKVGLLSLVQVKKVRGVQQKFYRANTEAMFSDREWAALEEDERRAISRVVWQRFAAQVEGAIRSETFDSRVDRWLAWGPMDLDERGWREFMTSIAGSFAEVEQIRRDAETRLAESDEKPIRTTFGLFGFESPPRLT